MSEFAVRWIFLLDQDYTYNLSHHLAASWREGWAFVDSREQRRLEIRPNGDAVVLAGYAWAPQLSDALSEVDTRHRQETQR